MTASLSEPLFQHCQAATCRPTSESFLARKMPSELVNAAEVIAVLVIRGIIQIDKDLQKSVILDMKTKVDTSIVNTFTMCLS